jgi:hypothetical protein
MIMMGLGCGRERAKVKVKALFDLYNCPWVGMSISLSFLSLFYLFYLLLKYIMTDLDENIFTFLSICENSKCF